MKTQKNNHFFRINRRIDEDLYLAFEKFCSKIPPNDPSQIVYFLFNTKGGDLGSASKITNLREKLLDTVICISYGDVHSSAIPIFSSGKLRLAKYSFCTFLFHRASKEDGISEEEQLSGERSAFSYIAKSIGTDLDLIYKIANAEKFVSKSEAIKLGLVHSK